MGFSQAQLHQRNRVVVCAVNQELGKLAETLHESQVTLYCGTRGGGNIEGKQAGELLYFGTCCHSVSRKKTSTCLTSQLVSIFFHSV